MCCCEMMLKAEGSLVAVYSIRAILPALVFSIHEATLYYELHLLIGL